MLLLSKGIITDGSQTLNPSARRQILWASIHFAQATSPCSTMHSSRSFFVSGQAQHIFFLAFDTLHAVAVPWFNTVEELTPPFCSCALPILFLFLLAFDVIIRVQTRNGRVVLRLALPNFLLHPFYYERKRNVKLKERRFLIYKIFYDRRKWYLVFYA